MFHHRKRLIGRFDARLADLIGRLGAGSCHVASLANAAQTTSSPRRPHPLVGFAARFGSCSRATCLRQLSHLSSLTVAHRLDMLLSVAFY